MYHELEDEFSQPGEIILGNGKLTAIFLVSSVICGTCFGLGYSLGRHAAAKAAEADALAFSAPASSYATEAKPSPGSPHDLSVPPASDAQPASDSGPAATTAKNSQDRNVVKPRKNAAAAANAIASPAPALTSAATTGDHAFAVQVAAITRQSDADILVAALQRKGYQVNAVANPQDHLIHVQVGPFSNQKDAAAMRDRLSDDGYLAIVK